jgi:hypothetical protein
MKTKLKMKTPTRNGVGDQELKGMKSDQIKRESEAQWVGWLE